MPSAISIEKPVSVKGTSGTCVLVGITTSSLRDKMSSLDPVTLLILVFWLS
jgi:hypothetical protein